MSPQDVPALPTGMDADSVEKGVYLQNMERHRWGWRTRKGLGQVSEFDSTFLGSYVENVDFLGCAIIKTDFGHEQIISVRALRCWTGEQGVLFGNGLYGVYYVVSVYDATTDEWYEEMLHPRTSEQGVDNPRRHALYESDLQRNYEDYLRGTDDAFWFTEFGDTLFFGSKRAGAWAYRPATYRGKLRRQINSVDYHAWHNRPYGEGACFIRMFPCDGLYGDAYVYLNESEFPRPVDVAAVGNRLAYADGKVVYFSDPERPASIAADNFITVPSENDITSVQALLGNLLVRTTSETFFYQIPDTFLASGGRLIKVSESVGCSGPTASCSVQGAAWWADRNGVYTTSNGLDIRPLMEGVEDFWKRLVSNPMTNYHQQSGYSSLTADQPGMAKRWDANRVNLVYDHFRNQLLLTVPSEGISLVWRDGWSVWTYSSQAGPANTVQRTENIRNPWLVMGQEDLYCLGTDTVDVVDDAKTYPYASPSGDDVTIGSLYVLRYGHGGSLDRSVESKVEDVRGFYGKYIRQDNLSGVGSLMYIRPWIPVPVGYEFPSGRVAPARTWLLPIEIAPYHAVAGLPDKVVFTFFFDNTKWVPLLKGASAELEYLLPTERVNSEAGYAPGAPIDGTRELQLWDTVGGAPDPTGHQVRLIWDGNAAGYTGHWSPNMQLTRNGSNPLIYLPFTYQGNVPDDVGRMGIYVVAAQLINTKSVWTKDCSVYVWEQACDTIHYRHPTTDPVQPVDWTMKLAQFSAKGRQLKTRGLELLGASSGNGSSPIYSTALYGLLNALGGSDYKGWATQIVDATNNLAVHDTKQPLRSRLKNTANAMVRAVFGGGDAHWAQVGTPATGNMLIGDEAVDRLAISDSVKGQSVSWMLFGHLRDKAEYLKVSAIDVALRLSSGGKRRKGR